MRSTLSYVLGVLKNYTLDFEISSQYGLSQTKVGVWEKEVHETLGNDSLFDNLFNVTGMANIPLCLLMSHYTHHCDTTTLTPVCHDDHHSSLQFTTVVDPTVEPTPIKGRSITND